MTISVHDRDPGHSLRAQRRRCDRVPGSRRRADRRGVRAVLRQHPWVWEQPLYARFLERLASFSRLILFDKRGTGLSDRPRWLTLEAQMDDIQLLCDGRERRRLQELRETGATGLEPATSGVTGRRSNQLNYAPELR
jgi:pimeloyl-ACP methyl ester carboxylesterase